MTSITVTNATELASAIAAARGGETIYLAPGTYADVLIRSKVYSAPVTFTSLDPANQAQLGLVNVWFSSNIVFKSLDMGFALPAGQAPWAKMINLDQATNVTFDDISFHGSLDGNAGNDCDGLSVLNSNYITVRNSEFQQLRIGALFGNSNHINVENNSFHHIARGGVLMAESQHIRIASNHFTDFIVAPGEHPDAIQFWETGTSRASKHILIMDNVILQGAGNSMQGIILGDNKPEFQYEDVRILNNLIYQSAYNGIAVNDAVGAVVEGNTVLSATDDGVLHRIYVLNSEDTLVRGNLAEILLTENNTPSVRFERNMWLRDNPSFKSQIRDLEAGAAATVEGLVVPGYGYRIPPVTAPLEAPRYGGDGNDAFYMGATLDSADRIYARGGVNDQLGIQGNYANLVLGSHNLVDVETLVVMSGSDTRFGDLAGNFYSYVITSVDANVAAGGRLTINANQLRPGESVRLDGSAETDGEFFFFGSRGQDVVVGGRGNDSFFFGTDGRFTLADRIDGGLGDDQLGLRGDYSAQLVFAADTSRNVETLVLLSAADTRFSGGGGNFRYNIATHDANVAAGTQMTINGAQLQASEWMIFNGSAETNGSFRILAGRANDTLTGSHCDDLIYGNLGKDTMAGGAGADTFLYRFAAESTGINFDRIVGFDCRTDKLDMPIDLGGFTDIVSGGALSAVSFDANLAVALAGVLGAGEAALFTAGSGDFAGRIFGIVDANGVAGYQAGADYVFEFVAPTVPISGDIFV